MIKVPSSRISSNDENGGLAISDSAKLIFNTIRNGAKKKTNNQKKGIAIITLRHDVEIFCTHPFAKGYEYIDLRITLSGSN
jgi:hypothetical protein